MRTVEAAKFVGAPPDAVERVLTPRRIVEYEGSFTVRGVEERYDATVVTVGGPGLELRLRFEPRDRGYDYEQLDDGGPLDAMTTTLTYTPENEGTRVSASSSVSLGAPPAALTDRIAGWKRRGELDRLLDALAETVE
ncbi:Polyketide cyclase / dehydrase and lipid transport [Natronoarchaeum philippinense]|uniref:Polyketide cyclase / dehydrase and lipid transport n=1 Tax=Natronoarchaeum philippinense TaxID=558529 RepID=A0A285PBY5_NATPI|nr:SRPBCC family protein [Natronoarchaeum philippinense]SNZ17646.1 Polyketide cyclase / dehydrase and lipid transport [Natronoarchaeum philippinense]